MGQYRKVVPVEAFQIPAAGDINFGSFLAWAYVESFEDFELEGNGAITLETLEGTLTAQPSDWIIKGSAGEFYPCRAEIFAQDYNEVDTYDPFDGWHEAVEMERIANEEFDRGYAKGLKDGERIRN